MEAVHAKKSVNEVHVDISREDLERLAAENFTVADFWELLDNIELVPDDQLRVLAGIDNPNIAKLLVKMEQADCISIDDGPLITDWELAQLAFQSESELLSFSWVDEDGLRFNDVITEGGITDGRFLDENCFLAINNEGESTKIRMFTLGPLPDMRSSKEKTLTSVMRAQTALTEFTGSLATLLGVENAWLADGVLDLLELSMPFVDHAERRLARFKGMLT